MSLGDDLPELLTVREVATFLRVSPLTIKRWGKRGKLPAIRINARGDRRYKKEAVLWILGEMKKEPGAQIKLTFIYKRLFLASQKTKERGSIVDSREMKKVGK